MRLHNKNGWRYTSEYEPPELWGKYYSRCAKGFERPLVVTAYPWLPGSEVPCDIKVLINHKTVSRKKLEDYQHVEDVRCHKIYDHIVAGMRTNMKFTTIIITDSGLQNTLPEADSYSIETNSSTEKFDCKGKTLVYSRSDLIMRFMYNYTRLFISPADLSHNYEDLEYIVTNPDIVVEIVIKDSYEISFLDKVRICNLSISTNCYPSEIRNAIQSFLGSVDFEIENIVDYDECFEELLSVVNRRVKSARNV